MTLLKNFWIRFRSLWQRPAVKREIDEELRWPREIVTNAAGLFGLKPFRRFASGRVRETEVKESGQNAIEPLEVLASPKRNP